MASAWSEEETFVCAVCLEVLKDPATLPCGHSYCLVCIQGHWDRGDTKGQYSCPQCRQVFKPRPSLARSTVLVEAMEKLMTNSVKQSPHKSISSAPPSMPIYLEVLPDTGLAAVGGPQRQGSVYPELPTLAPRSCPQHQKPLDLYCHDDKECVCEECCQHGHKGHRVLKPHEARRERQKELVQMQADMQGRIHVTEKALQELPQSARQHKASIQALQREGVDSFSGLVKSIELMGTQIGSLLCAHEASLSSRAEGHIHRLEQEVAQLRWKSEEMSRLADMQDHVCFLKNFLTLEPLGPTMAIDELGLGQKKEVVAVIRSAMVEFRDSIQDLSKGVLAKIFKVVNDCSMTNGVMATGTAAADDSSQTPTQNPGVTAAHEKQPNPMLTAGNEGAAILPYSPPINPQAALVTEVEIVNPEPKTREDLLKFRFDPTMDSNTAYRHLLLSDWDRKATLRAENLNPPDHPERFQFWRQILCQEPLGGSPYYWEVEWTGQKMTIGVAYREMERKGSDNTSRLGHNAQSWSLYWSGTGFSFWHKGQETLLGSPKSQRVGIYLDQHAGVLAFYRIHKNQAHLIHKHQSQFNGPLYPGFRFWSGVGSTLTVCKLN
ncbi:finTRIM family, member 86 [Lampris incognitus]|uniref:finTRIM family, member 86 n=1 Tax=Lampris incognitus TaxID=2546036 RepID=UPI0024B5A8B3|nr:finTRIM family, member 86 [Lampris incognitus]